MSVFVDFMFALLLTGNLYWEQVSAKRALWSLECLRRNKPSREYGNGMHTSDVQVEHKMFRRLLRPPVLR